MTFAVFYPYPESTPASAWVPALAILLAVSWIAWRLRREVPAVLDAKEGRLLDALDHLEAAVAVSPRHAQAWHKLGKARLVGGDEQETRNAWDSQNDRPSRKSARVREYWANALGWSGQGCRAYR